MADRGADPGRDSYVGAGAGAEVGVVAGPGGSQSRSSIAGALLAFEQVSVVASAAGVREAGVRTLEDTRGLVAALDAASAAAGHLVCGSALAECADLLARRARDLESEIDMVATGMERAMGTLVAADEEVARRVADVAG